jgi:hypothetical protein
MFTVSLVAGTAKADSSDVQQALEQLNSISESDIRESAIAFFNTSTTPGLEGATLSIDTADRDSAQWRSSLGFEAEFTIKNHVMNGYWGLALVGGSMEDTVYLETVDGDPVVLDVRRDLIGARANIGLSLPVDKHLKIRPLFTIAISDYHAETDIYGLTVPTPFGETITDPSFVSNATMLSSIGTIEAAYIRWIRQGKFELSGRYNFIHNQAISEDNPILDTDTWNRTSMLKGMYSNNTSLMTKGRPWRWLVYASHTNFITINKSALGYTGLLEVGTGLEWHLNIKPLDWFGWQSVGIKLGVITSRDVEGINFGLTAR